MCSRGSIIPFFIQKAKEGVLPITDNRMTRFLISLEQGIELVWKALEDSIGGEIYVKKIPSMKITDIAKTIAPNAEQEIVGVRPGEKIHEQMIASEDSPFTYEYADYFKILPQIHDAFHDKYRIKDGVLVEEGFSYTSDNNSEWMSQSSLNQWLVKNQYILK
jgi:FlaA1/EpsC-like NDP-sugar epimerase